MQDTPRVVSVFYGALRVLVRPVLLRATAVGIAVGVPAFVLSAGNGLRAVDVMALLHGSLAARCLLWTGWLVLAGPPLRSVFVAPGSLSLRALRLPRTPLLLALFLLCAAVELPWVLLFARAAGALAAWAALTASVALGALAVSARARPRGWAVIALGALLVACDPPWLWLACAGTLAAPFALRAAWQNAHEHAGLHLKWPRPRTPLFAVYAVHALRLLRAERSRLCTALVAVGAGALGVALSLRNDPSERPVQRALLVMALPLTVAGAVCVAPLLENERRLLPVLRSLRVRRSAVLGAFLLAVSTPSSALAATTGVVIAESAALTTGPLSLALLCWAMALGCAVALWGRWLNGRARQNAGTYLAGVCLISVLATLGAYTW